jgi:hypothetical protein
MVSTAAFDGASRRLSLCEFFDLFGGTPGEVVEVTRCGERPGPALCSTGCRVELHAQCPHGAPSVLLTLIQYGYTWKEIEACNRQTQQTGDS